MVIIIIIIIIIIIDNIIESETWLNPTFEQSTTWLGRDQLLKVDAMAKKNEDTVVILI